MNCGPSIRNTSGFRGISFHKSKAKWKAYIKKDGKFYHLGYFDVFDDAKVARDTKAQELFGDFAYVA